MGYASENYSSSSMATSRHFPNHGINSKQRYSPKRRVLSSRSNSPTLFVPGGNYCKNHPKQIVESDFSKFLYLLNKERFTHNIPPLIISHELSQLGSHHAQWMVDNSSTAIASGIILHLSRTSNKAGQNVGRAHSCEEAHMQMMSLAGDRSRIVDYGYTEIGVGTARGSDGSVFVCEIFRG